MKKIYLTSVAVTCLLAGLTGAVQAQDFKPRLVRFGYGLVEDSNQGRAVRMFAKEVEKASGGKMKVRAIGNASLGSDTQMQQALIGGAQEMMVGSTATLVGIVPEMAVWDTPFLFANVKEADTVLDGPVGEKVKAKLEPKGMVGLVYWENGFRNLTNSKRPVTKLEDMGDIKLRVMQNNVFLDSFKALGANAVPLPFSELFTALETRAVDGQENPFNTVVSSKLLAWFKSDWDINTDNDDPLSLSMASDKLLDKAGATPSKGSSNSNNRVPTAMARAKATSFCCPPDNNKARRCDMSLRTGNMS